MKPIIPILIPIYNGEPYIRECMDSIFGQTYHDFEIICMHIPEHTRSVFRRLGYSISIWWCNSY